MILKPANDIELTCEIMLIISKGRSPISYSQILKNNKSETLLFVPAIREYVTDDMLIPPNGKAYKNRAEALKKIGTLWDNAVRLSSMMESPAYQQMSKKIDNPETLFNLYQIATSESETERFINSVVAM